MRAEPVLDQMHTTGNGGCHHAGRRTKYVNMTVHELLSQREVEDLREASDAVEELAQRLAGRNGNHSGNGR